jgi:hypothetical protein
MDAGSDEDTDRNRSFIGFYTDPAVKETAQRRAQQEGVSLSEWMRRRLEDLDAGGRKPATT